MSEFLSCGGAALPEQAASLVEAGLDGAFDELVTELDLRPAQHVRVDDLLDGDLTAYLLSERDPQPFPVFAGQRLGHPNRRHHPMLLGRSQSDESLNGMSESSLPRRHRSSG